MTETLLQLFLDLVRIPSSSGHESEVAAYVATWLRDRGLEVVEDDAGERTGADCGNLFVRVRGRGDGLATLFCAHLDTVPVDGPVEPIVEDGVVRTAGGTILGADDKAAVAVLMLLLDDLRREPPAGTVEVLFTVSEEVGLQGAKAFALDEVEAEAGFVLDSSGPLGEVIIAAPASRHFEAEFRGTAAHAGIEPEKGHSAVLAASRAVSAMRLGRIDELTTANVGAIEGGGATNIVPDHCVLKGEARSRDEARLSAQIGEMIDAVHTAAADIGVDVVVEVSDDYEAFALPRDAVPAAVAAAALEAEGIAPRFVGTGGGSDVNVFNIRGLQSVNLSAGYERVHTPDESMPIDQLEAAHRVVRSIVAEAGRRR